jgi:hypothetical protein
MAIKITINKRGVTRVLAGLPTTPKEGSQNIVDGYVTSAYTILVGTEQSLGVSAE